MERRGKHVSFERACRMSGNTFDQRRLQNISPRVQPSGRGGRVWWRGRTSGFLMEANNALSISIDRDTPVAAGIGQPREA